jgi:hypothetical protein
LPVDNNFPPDAVTHLLRYRPSEILGPATGGTFRRR